MWRKEESICFVEEIFLINLYGNEREKHMLEMYLDEQPIDKNLILQLASDIKRRVSRR